MPRTRSVASPPPRRSAKSDRPRSVSRLAHRIKKPVAQEHTEETELHAEETIQDPKLDLIRAHAVARAERHRSSLGAGGMIAVVVTCVVIFAGWWALPDFFEKPAPLVITAPVATPSSTTQFVPEATTSSTVRVPTSTERRLLLPLTPPTSTNTLH